VKASLLAASLVLAAAGVPAPAHSQRACPERVQLGFGETAADIAWRCGVTPEALDRANPGLSRANERVGVTLTVPRPTLRSRQLTIGGNRFVPVPTPPGALGR
jgi:hypothetical protein